MTTQTQHAERAIWKVRYYGSPDLKGYNIYSFKNEIATHGEFVVNLGENGDAAETLCAAHNAALLADSKAGGEVVAWKSVVGYEGLYEVSNHGHLKNVVTGANRSTNSLAGAGYVKADLWKDGFRKQTYMHRLVAEAFIGPINDMEVNHKNGIKTDNRVENLEIVTKSENEQHSRYELGNLCKPVVGISASARQFYPSIEEAARKTSASAAGIYRCLNGQAKDSGGLKWEYATDVDTHPQQQAAPGAVPHVWKLYGNRQDFERYAAEQGYRDFEQNEFDGYKNSHTQARWNFWRAGQDAMLSAAPKPSPVPDGLIAALRNQRQVDEDGTECGVSRQAVDEAIKILESLSAAPKPQEPV